MPTPTLEKDAVLSQMTDHPAVSALIALGEGLIADARLDRGELSLTVVPEGVREAALALQGAGYNFLEDVTAVDWAPSEPRFQITYHILSHSRKERVRLRTF